MAEDLQTTDEAEREVILVGLETKTNSLNLDAKNHERNALLAATTAGLMAGVVVGAEASGNKRAFRKYLCAAVGSVGLFAAARETYLKKHDEQRALRSFNAAARLWLEDTSA